MTNGTANGIVTNNPRNRNLNAAMAAKDDEFYTCIEDIEEELYHYRNHFKEKTILLNCGDSELSNFFVFFTKQFLFLGLKRLIAIPYNENGTSYILDIIPELIDNKGIFDFDLVKKPLIGNGDFRSNECIDILKQADIVVTNPPFSLFKEYVAQLIQYNKQFLIIGSAGAGHYKAIFPLLKNNEIWVGYTSPKEFIRPDGSSKGSFSYWYTNLDITKRHEELSLTRKYNPDEYSHYDNADAIHIEHLADIPSDFYGVMGVPITIFNKYSPEQFELIGRDEDCTENRKPGYISGKRKFKRIFIKRV